MSFPNRSLPWDKTSHSRELLLAREWLVTNGLGGFASGTISGAINRRYHGLLIAALPAPHGRMGMWSHVSEFFRFADEDVVSLGAEERAGGQLNLGAADYLHEFRLENGLPVWTYHVRDLVLEKRILMRSLQIDLQESNIAEMIVETEEWGIVNVLAPEAAIAAEEERRAKMLDDALPEARRGFPAELVFAGDRSEERRV